MKGTFSMIDNSLTTAYKLIVTIQNPEDSKQKITKKLRAVFSKDPEQYGNGTFLGIRNLPEDKNYFEQNFDIRYDTSYSRKSQEVYLLNWVYNYWTGENGSFDVKEVSLMRYERG